MDHSSDLFHLVASLDHDRREESGQKVRARPGMKFALHEAGSADCFAVIPSAASGGRPELIRQFSIAVLAFGPDQEYFFGPPFQLPEKPCPPDGDEGASGTLGSSPFNNALG